MVLNDTMTTAIRPYGGTVISSSVLRGLVLVKTIVSSGGRRYASGSSSGTIIAERNILTAAHCISSRQGRIVGVAICVNTKYEPYCDWKYEVNKYIVPRF